jgi:hypothetical protein
MFFSEPAVAESGGKVFIFSGYGGTTTKGLYHQIGLEYQKKGVEPVYVEIDWDTDSVVDYVRQGRDSVLAEKEGPIFFYGFSMGGLVALSLCEEFKPVSVIVSSVAPFFEEDIRPLNWYHPHKLYNWYLFGDSKSTIFQKLVSDINALDTSVEILVGSEENERLKKRSRILSSSLVRGTLTEMVGVSHGISKHNHIDYIVDAVNKIPAVRNETKALHTNLAISGISGKWMHVGKPAIVEFNMKDGEAHIYQHDEADSAGLNLIKDITPSSSDENSWIGIMFDGYQNKYVEVSIKQVSDDFLTIATVDEVEVLRLKRE